MDLISTSWSCERCGAAFISSPPDTGLCDDCIVASFREIFGPGTVVLNTTLTGSVRDMLADAIAYRDARMAGCLVCAQAVEGCSEHEADRARVESYRQLASMLTGSRS